MPRKLGMTSRLRQATTRIWPSFDHTSMLDHEHIALATRMLRCRLVGLLSMVVLVTMVVVSRGDALKHDWRTLYTPRTRIDLKGAKLAVTLFVPMDPPLYQMVLDTGKRSKRIWKLGQLRGLVDVRTADAALDFVRLRTSPATWKYVGLQDKHGDVEVAVRDPFDAKLTFGANMHDPGVGSGGYDGWYGLVSKATARKIRLEAPKATAVPSGFVVSRTVVDMHSSKPPMVRLTEFVGFDGSWKMMSRQVIELPKGRMPHINFWWPPEH